MLDDAAFLQVICADPDADGPRLRYADYLDERGDRASADRAEFIRVQCALAAADPADPVVGELGLRERALLSAGWPEWLKPACLALAEPTPVSAGRGGGSDRYALKWVTLTERQSAVHVVTQPPTPHTPYFHSGQFRRGSLSHVALVSKSHKSAAHVARLFERAPIDGLTLVSFPQAEVGATLTAVDAPRLRALELIGCPPEAVRAVVTCRSLDGLRDLIVMGAVGAELGVLLGNANSLPGLRTLILYSCNLDGHGIERLCSAPFAARLEHLVIGNCGLTNASAAVLARHFPRESRLGYLGLTYESLTGRTMNTLHERFGDVCDFGASAPNWPVRYYR